MRKSATPAKSRRTRDKVVRPRVGRPASRMQLAPTVIRADRALSLTIDTQLQMVIFAEATSYLQQHKDELGIASQWLADLQTPPGPDSGLEGAHLRWLRFEQTDGGAGTPPLTRSSFTYFGTGPGADQGIAVLLATLFWNDGSVGTGEPLERRLEGGQGLRVVLRIVPHAGLTPDILVMTASSSLPQVPAGLNVQAWNQNLSSQDVEHLLGGEGAARSIIEAGLDPSVYGANMRGLRLGDLVAGNAPSAHFLARLVPAVPPSGASLAGWPSDTPAYAFEGVVRSQAGEPPRFDGARRYPLFAQLNKKVYDRDPPTSHKSRVLIDGLVFDGVPGGHPARSFSDLDNFRVTHPFGTLTDLTDPKGRFFVAQSRHVEGGAPGFDENKPVPLSAATDDSMRTDGAAALNAYVRAADFFERLDDRYGLPMNVHFAFANLPIIVRYRAGITPGAGDGRTINAQVRWAPTMPPTTLPSNLEVRLALADMDSNEGRVRAIDRTGVVRRAPLSISVASRWCWHEFGHVLIAGATGALELEFAHSVGDALGAILCDPDSALADEKKWRGVTFPFQSLPNRRHDQRASDGWSWSGILARPTRYFAGVDGHHVLNRGGYTSEQIMSSTLFRLYRALGGDARKRKGAGVDKDFRKRAAEHAVALIMRGIGIFGAASVSVVRTADDFAKSVMAADTAMAPLTIGGGTRFGGMAHKVVRWAFERQGAFAGGGSPKWDNNGPGLPPEVDVFIASRRKGERGGYRPIPFNDDQVFADPQSLWIRRKPPALTVDQAPLGGQVNYVFVLANNRGSATALATMARVWVAKLPSGKIPPWTDASWVALAPHTASANGPHDVPPDTLSTTPGVGFGPFRWPSAVSGASYAILAEMSCATDLSNLDGTPALPCATALCDVEELVAFDNNLALRIVKAA